MKIAKEIWGAKNGKEIALFTLVHENLRLKLTNLGCTIVAIELMSGDNTRNLVLGYGSAGEYWNDPYYVGCIAGRYAGRIARASIDIDGRHFPLSANENGHHLHGGFEGFSKKIFDIQGSGADEEQAFVRFFYRSADGEEGYPGNLDLTVTISLLPGNEILIVYDAQTDQPTHLNLTHHCYYNLSGTAVPATNHELVIAGDWIVVADEKYIPTGELRAVAGTRSDFLNKRVIAKTPEKISHAAFNECYALPQIKNGQPDAILSDTVSHTTMHLYTTNPGIVFYSGDFLNDPFVPCQGICLETEFFPDTPHHAHFPSTLLRPGDTFHQETKMKIS